MSSFYYKSTIFIILAVLFASCGSKKASVAKNKSLQQDIVDYGKKYINTPYRYAGKGPNSFDCSGYTSFIYNKFGYRLNASSTGQARQSEVIARKRDLKIGDLVFFEGRRNNGRIEHVGIVSDIHKNGSFKFIHASTSNGVIISSSEEPYYRTRYLRGGRIINDISDNSQELKTKKNETTKANYTKAQTKVIYKETDNGFVTIYSTTKKPFKSEVTVSPKKTSKPIKRKEEKDKKRKQSCKVRQTAIRSSEETLATLPNHINHKVKLGETLYSIAKKYSCTVERLKKWNPDIVNNTIKAGNKLDVYQ